MAFKYLSDFLDKFNRNEPRPRGMKQAEVLDSQTPVFSQFGEDVYESDVVQMCIDAIATEISKLMPKHIRTNTDGTQTDDVNSNLNRIFKHGPNELMTTRDFLEKVIWLMYLKANCFIYPTYELRATSNTGDMRYTKHFTGFFPLNPKNVTFLQDTNGTMFVELEFLNLQKITLPYSDLIHLRWKFSINELMGGGRDGKPDNAAVLKTLSINESLLQGVSNAVETSFKIRGVLKINTLLDDESQIKERQKFEEKIRSGDSGILPLDLKGEYIDLKPDPKLVDKETLDFIDRKILRFYGVSLPILCGDYNDDQYQAFYEKTLEPIVVKLGQAFTKCVFTEREKDVGNEIVFYFKNMMYLSMSKKIELLKTVGEQGLFTNDEKLALVGYPPVGGEFGSQRTMSLNYIDATLASEYQMNKVGRGGSNLDEDQSNDE